MTIKFSDITGGGIPFGNNAGRPANPGVGKPYFNGELQRLELYTGTTYGWQNIVAETPGVTGYVGSVLESNSTNTITITGTQFAPGATASLIGTDGTEYIANSTTVDNLTSITAVFGMISASKEPYDIKVTNPSNLYGVYYDILTVNDSPVWQTSAGTLGTFDEGTLVSLSVSATDEENTARSYSVSSGSLPPGLSLNSSTGAITGTLSGIASTTTYSFNISASDGNNSSPRSFSITVNALSPVWVTSGTITTIGNGSAYSYQLQATDASLLTYSIVSGSLPSGITLSSSGLISGTTTAITTSTGNLSITFRATDAFGNFTNRTLTIPTSLYTFTSHEFTTAGVSGYQGPTLAQVRSAYNTTWDETYLTMTTQGIQEWTVPSSGNYYIDAYGAGGGGVSGGTGARIADTFTLSAGEVIRILVGQYGGDDGSGASSGGGGTFVVKSTGNTNSDILVIAGGGGGSEGDSSGRVIANADTGSDGKGGYNTGTYNTTGGGSGGTNGNGGNSAQNDNCGGGGGGFFTNGQNNPTWGNVGGKSFISGGLGAQPGSRNIYGGFGGGGEGGRQAGGGGAGAGGGYSGGGGGDNAGGSQGGGGGSYYANGLNINRVLSTTGTSRLTHGKVIVTKL
jgi:hypothetical protein